MPLAPELAAAIEALIRSVAGNAFELVSAAPLPGSSFHTNWLVEGCGSRFFVKTAGANCTAHFEAECDGLAALAAASEGFRVPRTLGCGSRTDCAFLVQEYLPLQKISPEQAPRVGQALAALHKNTGNGYGWHRNNYLGLSLQTNSQSEHWPIFFAEQRLKPQLDRACAQGFRGSLLSNGERLCEKIGAFFLEYRPRPALLHGDLWSGNIAMLADGTPVLLGPAVYRGDRECDFALSELFGGLPERFYAAYRNAAPLDPGYERRKTLYNLYHILNHLNLYGRSYLHQAERMAAALVDHLRH